MKNPKSKFHSVLSLIFTIVTLACIGSSFATKGISTPQNDVSGKAGTFGALLAFHTIFVYLIDAIVCFVKAGKKVCVGLNVATGLLLLLDFPVVIIMIETANFFVWIAYGVIVCALEVASMTIHNKRY